MLTVVTTFADKHWDLYASKCLESFDKYWSNDVKLRVYLDQAAGPVQLAVENLFQQGRKDVKSLPLFLSAPVLTLFKDTYGHLPAANGTLHGDYSMRWDAVRFSHKVFALIHAATVECQTRYLLWLDADTLTHSPVVSEDVVALLREGDVAAWLNRDGNYPETGFILFDTHHVNFPYIIKAMAAYYSTGKILELEQTHDSWVWWQVIAKDRKLPVTELSGEWSKVSHPFIHVLGHWMDHLKGTARKEQGHSHKKDLKIERPESHWKNL